MSGSSGAIIGGPNLRLIDSITQFVNGTQAVWDDISVPIPVGLVVYAVDTTALKMGDGVTLYADLPVLFALNSIITIAEEIAALQAGSATTITLSQVETAINVALNATLANYVTTAALTTAFANRVTTAQLATAISTALSSYVATTALTTILTGYATTSALTTVTNGLRVKLTSDTTLYVSTTGNDTTGTGSISAPFATIQAARNYAYYNLDLQGHAITYNIGAGTFPPFCCSGPLLGQGPNAKESFVGAGSGSTLITTALLYSTTESSVIAASGAVISISGMHISNSAPPGTGDYTPYSSVLLSAGGGSFLGLGADLVLGVTGNAIISAWNGGILGAMVASTGLSIVGNARCFASAHNCAQIVLNEAAINFVPGLTFSSSVMESSGASQIGLPGATWSGSVPTGQRYFATTGGIVNTSSGNPNFIPGTLAGNTTGGGIYT